ncbi:helix-turn-helix transcriptional regulator [Nonomuraea sp. NPDC050786]|uniref:helix-turn-helix domain-containing protein n=1 Tax=Nonomuraea sp. NPDC050786 TaxID=3154840 RepID=UPI0033DBE469
MTRLTNFAFAKAMGCDHSTASKIRDGKRLPSLSLFARMVGYYELDANEGIRAYLRGRQAFVQWMNDRVFEPPQDEAAPAGASAQEPTFQEPTFQGGVAV